MIDPIAKKKVLEFLSNGQTAQAMHFIQNLETNKKVRTGVQNGTLHLFFTQVADECVKNGVDTKMIVDKTVRVDMSPEFIKTMWKTLQTALFGTTSTTQLKKTGEIDKIYDHFVRFFAESFEMEIPPFPSREREDTLLNNLEKAKGIKYPEHNGEMPTI